ncbi:unnamed protein product [Musa textilis]
MAAPLAPIHVTLDGSLGMGRGLLILPEVAAQMPPANQLFNLPPQLAALFGVVSILPMEATIPSSVGQLPRILHWVWRLEQPFLLYLEKYLGPRRTQGGRRGPRHGMIGAM